MLLGFKRRFSPLVKDGSKRHTLRTRRAGDRQVRVGDRLDCYVDPRQKTMALLGRFPCILLQEFRVERKRDGLYAVSHIATIDGGVLDFVERDLFAWADGFRFRQGSMPARVMDYRGDPDLYSTETDQCFNSMMSYWEREGAEFPLTKDLIHWDFNKPLDGPKKSKLDE